MVNTKAQKGAQQNAATSKILRSTPQAEASSTAARTEATSEIVAKVGTGVEVSQRNTLHAK